MLKQSASIAYILQIFPGPTQTFIYREVLKLRERGFTVYTFSTQRPDSDSLSDEAKPLIDETFYILPIPWLTLILVHLRYLFGRPLRYLGTLAFVLTRPGESFKNRRRTLIHFILGMLSVHEIERLNLDHIHAHFGWGPSSIALIAGRMLDIPFSVTFHSFHSKKVSYPGRLLAEDKIRYASFIVSISNYHREFLKTLVPENNVASKIHIIHQGLDPQVFMPSTEAKRNNKVFTFIGVGQLIYCKGFHVLIEACHHLTTRGVPFCCHIFGEGPERNHLEELIDRYNLHEQVFLSGRIDQKELRPLLNRIDAFALPCVVDEKSGRQDGLPVVLTEAMAMELPVVSTRISAIPELIKHEHNGLLTAPNDAVALADMLQCLKDNPGLRQQFGKAGRETVINEFNVERSMDRLAELFVASVQQRT